MPPWTFRPILLTETPSTVGRASSSVSYWDASKSALASSASVVGVLERVGGGGELGGGGGLVLDGGRRGCCGLAHGAPSVVVARGGRDVGGCALELAACGGSCCGAAP
jgi:hypothetical protein